MLHTIMWKCIATAITFSSWNKVRVFSDEIYQLVFRNDFFNASFNISIKYFLLFSNWNWSTNMRCVGQTYFLFPIGIEWEPTKQLIIYKYWYLDSLGQGNRSPSVRLFLTILASLVVLVFKYALKLIEFQQ